jgi:pyruvate,water dikinase
MECAAMKKVRNEMGLTNVQLMVPFVRNVEEARAWSTCWPSTA